MTQQQTALIIGASRGLGLALAEEYCSRDWHVIATQRTPSTQLAALAARYPRSLTVEIVDIDDAASVQAVRGRLGQRQLDTLFVNAGICKAREATPRDADPADFLDMMATNALAPVRAVEILEDRVPQTGVIAVMSSEIGSIANNNGFWELYSASKAALNMLMHCFAGRHAGDPRALLLVAPGWIKTDLGTDAATYSVEEAIPLVVDTVERNRGRAGLRFVNNRNQVLPW
ncbi:MAG TPA: SDR family NAD(P)-dependent oxidoreductase [Dongiaceae bacterium]|nr:SDR family NAD(P)-dependent oxidoreductase [Dongiaceae bacterium]